MKRLRPVLMILALGVLFYALYRRTHPVQQARPASGGPYSLEIRPLPVSHTLALGDFEVPARSSHDVKIVLDEPHMQNARVTGNFSTESVSGIQVMLLNEIEYNQFTGDHKIPPGFLYLSKTTTNGNIQAAIPQAGNYYLVFDNSPSDSSIKVKAEVTVHYETVHVDTPPAQPPPPKK